MSERRNYSHEILDMYPERGTAYLKFIDKTIIYSEHYLMKVIHLLQKRETHIPTQLINQLKSFEAQSTPSPRVERALEGARKYFTQPHVQKTLASIPDLQIFYYGSLQYKDPRNCDGDFVIVSYTLNPQPRRREKLAEIEDELYLPFWRYWEKENLSITEGAGVHLEICDLNYLDETPITDRMLSNTLDTERFLSCLPEALTGRPLFDTPENREEAVQNKKQTKKIIDSDPFISGCVKLDLEACIEERRKRTPWGN